MVDMLNEIKRVLSSRYVLPNKDLYNVKCNGNNSEFITQCIHYAALKSITSIISTITTSNFNLLLNDYEINYMNKNLIFCNEDFKTLLETCTKYIIPHNELKDFKKLTSTMFKKISDFTHRMKLFELYSNIRKSVGDLQRTMLNKGASIDTANLFSNTFCQCAEYMINSCLAFADCIKLGYRKIIIQNQQFIKKPNRLNLIY